MLSDLSVDFGTIAVLSIVVWLDGWRRLPTGTLLVARSGFAPWAVRAPWARAGPFALVALWAPIVVPLLLSPEPASAAPVGARWMDDFHVSVARSKRRLRRVRPAVAFLRALGLLLILWIIAGIPLATARFGGPGLIYGVLGAFLLAIEMTLVTTISLGSSLGIPLRRSFRTTAQLLSPFTAPRAAETLTGAAVGQLHSLAPVAAVLGEARFLTWVRPWAYDELAGRHHADEDGEATVVNLVSALPRRVLERAVGAAVHDEGDDGTRYCPRCTRTYREMAATCSNCNDLALVAVHGPSGGDRGDER